MGAWWGLRASIIDDCRARKAAGAEILNSRLDFQAIKAGAENGDDAVVFTELREHFQVGGGSHTLIRIGSQHQPFSLFIPNTDDPPGQEILRLLDKRYISAGDGHPRRSYAYVSGALSLFPAGTGDPQIVITDLDQVTDLPSG